MVGRRDLQSFVLFGSLRKENGPLTVLAGALTRVEIIPLFVEFLILGQLISSQLVQLFFKVLGFFPLFNDLDSFLTIFQN